MSVLEIETPEVDTLDAQPTAPGPRRTRPARGRGRASGPRLRPARSVPAPTVLPETRSAVRACVAEPQLRPVPAAPLPRTSSWRLTDRGIAVVLVAVAMVTVAAFAVLVPTALRVTGDSYQPIGTSRVVTP